MIELKSARFVKYDNVTKNVIILLLTEDNESLEMDVLLGFPEVMTKELIDQLIAMNASVARTHGEDDEIDMQKINRHSLDEFFSQIITYITYGRMKGALEAQISNESLEE